MKYKLIFLAFLILIPVTASALTTRYVNAASSGGDGTTNATSGSTAAYASLDAAITALSAVSDDIEIYCEGTTVDSVRANVTGMSATSLLIEGDGDYTIDNSDYSRTFSVLQDDVTIRRINIIRRASGAVDVRGFFSSGSANLVVEDSTFTHAGTVTSDSNNELVAIAPDASSSMIFRNNYIFDSQHVGLSIAAEGSEDIYVHNNTIKDSDEDGLFINTGNQNANLVSVINNLVVGSGDDDITLDHSPTTEVTTTNATSDATSPESALRNVSVTFDTAPTLDSGDTDVIDEGTTIAAFSDDIYGTSRPQGSSWDIGAYELTASVDCDADCGDCADETECDGSTYGCYWCQGDCHIGSGPAATSFIVIED
jgi:hypothetical protein